MSLRVASLDYLGVVAARLRKDAVTSQLKVDAIDQIIKEIQDEEQREAEEHGEHKKKKVRKCNSGKEIKVLILKLLLFRRKKPA